MNEIHISSQYTKRKQMHKDTYIHRHWSWLCLGLRANGVGCALPLNVAGSVGPASQGGAATEPHGEAGL